MIQPCWVKSTYIQYIAKNGLKHSCSIRFSRYLSIEILIFVVIIKTIHDQFYVAKPCFIFRFQGIDHIYRDFSPLFSFETENNQNAF